MNIQNPTLVIQNGIAYYFQDFFNKTAALCDDLTEQEFWSNPYPYGNSIGHLILHITGNLNYYIGAQLASTGYVRNRPLEFSEDRHHPKAEVLHHLEIAVRMVIQTLEQQSAASWAAPYSAEGVDDVHDRFSIFLRCVVHFNHHLGHISYTKDEHIRRRENSI